MVFPINCGCGAIQSKITILLSYYKEKQDIFGFFSNEYRKLETHEMLKIVLLTIL